MKEANNNDSSRRDFIKTSAKIALGSTLVSGVGPKASAQPTPPSDLGDHPSGSNFKPGRLKLPRWLPDQRVEGGFYLFPEEAVRKDKNKGLEAFPPPGYFPGPFEEGSWILGVPFKKDPKSLFDTLIDNILSAVRRYNAALYWMRRLHFHEKAILLNIPISFPPPRNPNGDKDGGPTDDLTKWTTGAFKTAIGNAQTDWKNITDQLNDLLFAKPDPNFPQIWADMIQVNGYIVSMRVVAAPDAKEMGGSSSSHISISSAFSSPQGP
jgi:hypothetical protein